MSANKSIDKAKNKTYQTIVSAIAESKLGYEEIAGKLGVFPQSLRTSVRNKSLRVETLYQLETILKRKLVYSLFDDSIEDNAISMKTEIAVLKDLYQQLLDKVTLKK